MKQRTALFITLVIAILLGLAVLIPPADPAGASASGQAGGDEGGVQGGGGYFLTIAGNIFVPESSFTQFKTNAVGGTWVSGAMDRYMHAPLILPDGAQVYDLLFYYYDNVNPGFMTARLIRNNDSGFGNRTYLIQVVSPGPAVGGDHYDKAYLSLGSTPVVVDNSRYNYEIEVHWSTGSPDLRLMGVSLFYALP